MSQRLDQLLEGDGSSGLANPPWLVKPPARPEGLPYSYRDPSLNFPSDQDKADLENARGDLEQAMAEWFSLAPSGAAMLVSQQKAICSDLAQRYAHAVSEAVLGHYANRLAVGVPTLRGWLGSANISTVITIQDVARHLMGEAQLSRKADLGDGERFAPDELGEQFIERYRESLCQGLAASGHRWLTHITQEDYQLPWQKLSAPSEVGFWRAHLNAAPARTAAELRQQITEQLARWS